MPNVVILKNLPVKGLCGRCYICLRLPPLLWPHSPPSYTLYTCIQYTYSHREGGRGGELTREKVRGAIGHKGGRKYQHDWLYLQSINSIKTPVQSTFRVCCLYSFFLNIGAVPGILFIYFVISLTIHTLFFLGMFSCWVFFLTELGIWANNFLPARPRDGCREGIEPGPAVQQPSALITEPCCTLT